MSLNLNCLTPRLTTGYLNTQNDAYPGMSVAGTGANINQYLGQMGQELQLNYESAAALSYTTTGTLYAGKYQYVKFKAGSSPARGLALYWDDRANYVVTTVTPSGDANFAGICIMANTAGNYGWMQTEGDAVCQFKATLTKSAVAGDAVILTTTANTFDVLADATNVTWGTIKLMVGTAIEDPTNGGLKRVQIRPKPSF